MSTAKTAQSTPQNANPNANRTIGHYVVGKYGLDKLLLLRDNGKITTVFSVTTIKWSLNSYLL